MTDTVFRADLLPELTGVIVLKRRFSAVRAPK